MLESFLVSCKLKSPNVCVTLGLFLLMVVLSGCSIIDKPQVDMNKFELESEHSNAVNVTDFNGNHVYTMVSNDVFYIESLSNDMKDLILERYSIEYLNSKFNIDFASMSEHEKDSVLLFIANTEKLNGFSNMQEASFKLFGTSVSDLSIEDFKSLLFDGATSNTTIATIYNEVESIVTEHSIDTNSIGEVVLSADYNLQSSLLQTVNSLMSLSDTKVGKLYTDDFSFLYIDWNNNVKAYMPSRSIEHIMETDADLKSTLDNLCKYISLGYSTNRIIQSNMTVFDVSMLGEIAEDSNSLISLFPSNFVREIKSKDGTTLYEHNTDNSIDEEVYLRLYTDLCLCGIEHINVKGSMSTAGVVILKDGLFFYICGTPVLGFQQDDIMKSVYKKVQDDIMLLLGDKNPKMLDDEVIRFNQTSIDNFQSYRDYFVGIDDLICCSISSKDEANAFLDEYSKLKSEILNIPEYNLDSIGISKLLNALEIARASREDEYLKFIS